MKAGTLVRTLRHLKPSQLRHQAVHRLRQRVLGPPTSSGQREAVAEIGWQPDGEFPQPLCGAAEEILAGRLTFVNETVDCEMPPENWELAQASKLWRYNLHYFDWLWALVPENAVAAVDDWIDRHAAGLGQIGWDAYPMSLRLMNWVAFFCGEHRDFLELEENRQFRQRLFRSLTDQANCLLRCPEKHLLANHYLENGAALSLVGACFAGEPPASRWLEAGLAILDEQLPEQCPLDGLHFERSPMYHLRLVLVLQMLIGSKNAQIIERAQAVLDRALVALAHVTHPDGEIALLADSALEIYPSVKTQPSFGAFALPDAGYYGWRSENGDYLICDYGAPGPAYNPGHAHAGLFSFELSIAGQRVLSDSGAATYQAGEDRCWARSTAAHNTVELDGEDQAEMWGAFRVGRRPRVQGLKWSAVGENGVAGFVIEAEHDGYLFGKNPRTHWRRISFDAEARRLTIEDRIQADKEPTRARIAFHLEPGLEVVGGGSAAAGTGLELKRNAQRLATVSSDAQWQIEEAPIYRQFHQAKMRPSLVALAHETVCENRVEFRFG